MKQRLLSLRKHLLRNEDPASVERADSQLCGLNVPGSSFYGVAVITSELGDDLQQGGALVLNWLAIAVEPCLVLGTQHGHSGFEVWQAVPDVVHKQSAESFGQIA